ncbi:conserved protein of unknown function [Candidatus Nitrosocaldus cavascurensis]|uniref:Uncharacterized protein n=1 Tax=Candidatus Nitrosocaldus cavascurensis TaxID=2058097 RepID=A0A2K5ATH0_9ARCH|nr:conserved protein of unknown function [Candidatus Nitrosocaldus cavascurensis]
MIRVNFNPTIVRFKLYRKLSAEVSELNFNPTIVRFKRASS